MGAPILSRLGERAEKSLHRALYPSIGELESTENLERMSLPELYEILEDILAAQRNPLELARDSARAQMALLIEVAQALYVMDRDALDHNEANFIAQCAEEAFLERMKRLGTNIDYESDLSAQEIADKPALVLATHQGGGVEGCFAQGLTDIPMGMVVKQQMFNVPFVGKSMRTRGAIPVNRAAVKAGENIRMSEVTRIGRQVAARLSAGENMLIFFEGTRSRSGEIAATPNRKAWTKDIIESINREMMVLGMEEDFQKLLLVFNSKGVMPDAVEEDLALARFRLDGAIGGRLHRADDLLLEESEDPYDERTIFGKSRTSLKEMLIRDIVRLQAA